MLALSRMGDISWASLLEEEHGGTTVRSPPSSGIAPCVSEAGQMRCPLAPSDIIGQIQSLWFPHLLSGVSGDVKGPDHRYRDAAAQWPRKRGQWICPGSPTPNHGLPTYVLPSFPCILVLVFYGTQKQYKNHSCVLPHH